MVSRRTFSGLALGALAGCTRKKPFDGFVYVANEVGSAIAVVDLAIFAVIRHIRLEAPPTALMFHPQKPFLYALTPRTGSLHEISTEQLRVVRSASIGRPLTGMRASPDGTAFVYLLSREGRFLTRFSLDAMREEKRYPLPRQPLDFDVSEYTGFAGLSYGETGEVALLKLDSGVHGPLLKIGSSSGLVRFRSGGEALLAANPSDRMLTIVDVRSRRIVTHLPLAVRPERFCFNPDRGQLFITGEGMDAVVVVYPHDVPQVAETALAGRAPGAMAASEKFLLVANPLTDDLSIFNVNTRRLIAITQVGSAPGFIAITPDEQYALVLNQGSGDVAVINIAKLVPNRHKSVGLLTMIPVGSKPVAAVVSAA